MKDNLALAALRRPLPLIYAGPVATSNKTTDPAELVAQIQKTWEEFKATNDEALKNRDVVLTEKVDRINAHITQLEIDVKKSLDETAKAIARFTVGGEQPKSENDNKRFARAMVRDIMSLRGASPREIRDALRKDVNVEAHLQYLGAFDELIASNLNPNMLPQDMRNALQVGSDPSGGYAVPPERSSQFIKRLFETSEMRAIAGIQTISSDAWEQPNDTNDGTSGGFVGERAARTSTSTPEIGMQRIVAHEQYAFPQLTQKMLEDAVLIDPAGWLTMKTADKMGRTENSKFVLGNGVTAPRGFLDYGADSVTTDDATRSWGKLQYVPTGAAGAFPHVTNEGDDADCLINIVYKLKPSFRANARWAMARSSVAEVRKLKDNDGNYRWQPALQAGQPSLLLQFPITELEDMTAIAANSYSIAFGDFRQGYLIVDRLGLTVLVDPYTNKPYVGFYMRKRVGGDVVNFDAIKLLKFAAT